MSLVSLQRRLQPGPAPAPRAPELLMQPQQLAALQPSRLSASRALMVRAIRERWSIRRLQWSIDEKSRGTALYRIETPDRVFDFPVYSFEYRPEGRTGRIIGRAWDMMAALIDGPATPQDIAWTAQELPKLYHGRATANTLVWCRSNRSSRAFDHTVEALAQGRQPDIAEIGQVCYLMRNTGLDGNGTFGTITYRAIAADHPLAAPLAAQMLCAYMMRVFAMDLVHHLARAKAPRAVELDPRIARYLGVGNGSALGLVLFVNNHPRLVDRWLSARESAIVAAQSLQGQAARQGMERLASLLARASRFRSQDRMLYEVFAPSDRIGRELADVERRVRGLHSDPAAMSATFPLAQLTHNLPASVHPETVETLLSSMIELVPTVADDLGTTLAVDEEFTTQPSMRIAQLREILHTEYAWAFAMDLAHPSARRYVWYKSQNAEEPRRGPVEEVDDVFNLGLDLPGLVQALDRALAGCGAKASVARFLLAHPQYRAITARVQSLRGLAYHSPHMNMMADDFVPVHIVRMMNVALHGIDKTRDFLGRNLRGVLYHGAPLPEDIARGTDLDWFHPEEPAC
ncbi:MAG TPA: hypothetical protein VFC24_14355 [Casimicrobiaceae bacterium]|nr:hypothetical protein [Casimicrobiaceae bacterium]